MYVYDFLITLKNTSNNTIHVVFSSLSKRSTLLSVSTVMGSEAADQSNPSSEKSVVVRTG